MPDYKTNTDAIQYFDYRHLPPKLQDVSKAFSDIAHHLEHTLANCPQKDICMQKLLEAKDCAVRATLKS